MGCPTWYTSHMQIANPTTGLDLKLLRVAARVKQRPIADGMGVSVSRVASIERETIVSETTRQRYLDALTRATQAHQPAA